MGNLFLTTNKILIVNNHVFEKLLKSPHIKTIPKTLSLLFLSFLSLSSALSLESLSPRSLSLPQSDRRRRRLRAPPTRVCPSSSGELLGFTTATAPSWFTGVRCVASRTKHSHRASRPTVAVADLRRCLVHRSSMLAVVAVHVLVVVVGAPLRRRFDLKKRETKT